MFIVYQVPHYTEYSTNDEKLKFIVISLALLHLAHLRKRAAGSYAVVNRLVLRPLPGKFAWSLRISPYFVCGKV